MCLAIPVRVNAFLPDGMARVTLSGVSMAISIALVEDVEVGDYVIVHVGYALARIDPEEAERTLALMREGGVVGPSEMMGSSSVKYIEEYRDGRIAQTLAVQIAEEVRAEASYSFMESSAAGIPMRSRASGSRISCLQMSA